MSSGLVHQPHPPPWPAEAPMVQQRLSSEAEEFFPLSMPTDVSLHNQPEQPLVYVWIEDYREDYCSVAAWQVAATQPEDKDDDAYFGMADMGQQGLRAQAKEFVPSSMSTAVFLGPAAPVRAGPSCGEDSCAVGAVQVEARKSEVENDVVQCGMQTMQQKKVVKRLMNARLPMKRQGAEQQEVSCLPAEEWGLQALDAVEVPAQPRSLETKSLHILQARGQGSKYITKSTATNTLGRAHEENTVEEHTEGKERTKTLNSLKAGFRV